MITSFEGKEIKYKKNTQMTWVYKLKMVIS